MPTFKVVISDPKTARAYQIEISGDNSKVFLGKKIGDEIVGDTIGFPGYVFKITGGTDKDGFPMNPTVEGAVKKRVLLSPGSVGYRKRRRRKKVKGHRKRWVKTKLNKTRLRKTVRGNTIDETIVQINMKIIKWGKKSIEEILGKNKEDEKKE